MKLLDLWWAGKHLSVPVILSAGVLSAQQDPGVVGSVNFNFASDPGVRGGPAGAGGPLPGLTANQLAMFNAAKAAFQEINSVFGTIAGEVDAGLGPSFNLNSCGGCHINPDVGGSSPAVNPQIAVATLHGARNTIPPFIKIDGPVREARFKRKSDGSVDGGVHDLFVITGRFDAPPGCNQQQTDFAGELAKGNVIFRIPTPVFGSGMIEAIPDSAILANMTANASAKAAFGIRGRANRSGNDGTITRFGWKAQNPSLVVFSGEAYNVEQGVTNEVFSQPREATAACLGSPQPEDGTDFNAQDENGGDAVTFAIFMRFLAPPAPVASYGRVDANSIQRGHDAFVQVGCIYCHTESLKTGSSPIAALSNKDARLFSDLLIHDMGAGLADEIPQGIAASDEFRTAALWGLGKRIFFLHDGRTKDLVEAIQAHKSQGSEASPSVDSFNKLSTFAKQDLLNFLRSL